MTADVATVQDTEDVSSVLRKLADRDFTGLPVVDENDGLVGVVTRQDALRVLHAERASE
jgi:CBS domain-containing protein